MTKHDAMMEYLKEKLDMLSFNFSHGTSLSAAFLTNYSGKIVKKYIRAADKEYGFVILFTLQYSTYTDDVNLRAMNIVQEFMDWIEMQDKKENFPDFGDNCQIKKIENMQNMPNLAMVDMENNLAQYQAPCRVLYFEKER